MLIPRPETELLVETALDAIDGIASPCVLDLGTGSGAIAVSIASERPDARVWALERSVAALDVARRNARKLLDPARAGGPLRFLESDWYAALDPGLRFHVVVSNPPYIARHDPHLAEGDLRFEPRGALTDENDGLAAIRTIVAGAHAFVAPGGALWLEHGYDQAAAVRAPRRGRLRRRRIARGSRVDRARERRAPARLTRRPAPAGPGEIQYHFFSHAQLQQGQSWTPNNASSKSSTKTRSCSS